MGLQGRFRGLNFPTPMFKEMAPEPGDADRTCLNFGSLLVFELGWIHPRCCHFQAVFLWFGLDWINCNWFFPQVLSQIERLPNNDKKQDEPSEPVSKSRVALWIAKEPRPRLQIPSFKRKQTKPPILGVLVPAGQAHLTHKKCVCHPK